MALIFPWQKLRERRVRFRQDRIHLPESDFDFIRRAVPNASDSVKDWIKVLRQLIAELCGVPKDELYSEDSLDDIQKLLGPATASDFFLEVALEIVQEMMSSEFLTALEKKVSERSGKKVRLYGDDEFEKAVTRSWRESNRLGEWLARLAIEIEHRVGRPSSPAGEGEGNND